MYKITDECVACGTCLDECPNEAIKEGDICRPTKAPKKKRATTAFDDL